MPFIPDFPSIYHIYLFNNGEKYGDEIELDFVKRTYKGSSPILCSNNMCTANYIGCITPPPNGCDKSQTECNCPTGYNKCDFMNCCVREDRRDMWHKFQKRRSIQSKYYQDGLCKKEDARLPNQVVCPLGKVLFPDLTCKDLHSKCPLYPVLIAKVRCVEQTQVNNNFDCQTIISCSNPDDIVCPDGTCVENAIIYKPLKKMSR